jgi:hypothetical protein
MTDTLRPTQQDMDNAEKRAAIAQKQKGERGRVHTWALGAFGPGWEPVGRRYLVGKVGRVPPDAARCHGAYHSPLEIPHFSDLEQEPRREE